MKIYKVTMALFVFAFILSSFTKAQTARLQVIHNAADKAADSVDIYLNNTLLLDNFKFRQATPFIDAPAGEEFTVGVAPANSTSSNDALAKFDITLQEGMKYIAIANGVLDTSKYSANPEKRSTAFTLFIKEMAREKADDSEKVEFFVLHGATDAPSVDVYARGTGRLLSGAAYGDMTGYLAVGAGKYTLDITPADAPNSIVASFSADLSPLKGGSAAVLASGFLDSTKNQMGRAFGLLAVLADGTVIMLPKADAPSKKARLQVIHNAADTAADSVDIYLNNTLLLDNFGFRQATPFVDAPAGVEFTVGVAPSNSSSVNDVIAEFPITLEEGMKYIAIANGVIDTTKYSSNPNNRSIAFNLLIKQMAKEEADDTAKVELFVLHGATDAPAVDVYARNVGRIVENAAYGDMTDYLAVAADKYVLDITPADAPNTIVASFDADLTSFKGGSAAVLASGFLNPAANNMGEAFGLLAVLADGTAIMLPKANAPTDVTDNRTGSLDYRIEQNYPNPFNPSTVIRYSIPKEEFVSIKIYNILGKEVASLVNQRMSAGSYDVSFDAVNLAAGTYLYSIKAGNYSQTRKMLLLK